jgi:hypothetical protein
MKTLDLMRAVFGGLLLSLMIGSPMVGPGVMAAPAHDPRESDTYSPDEIVKAGSDFFGVTTENMAKAVERVFAKYGRPNAYIAGNEGSGAYIIGLRYGEGNLYIKGQGSPTKVYWQGPTAGLDFGANASKAFTLVYNLPNADAIFERFPGVEGTAYVIAGISVNYQQNGRVILAPMRTGVGLRLGINGGYLAYTKERNWIPF